MTHNAPVSDPCHTGTHDQSRRHPAGCEAAGYAEVEGNGCSIGPNSVAVKEAAAGRRSRFRATRRVHADLLGPPRPGLSGEVRRSQGRGHRRNLVRERQRRARDGRLGARPEHCGQGTHVGRRQRRLRQATGLTLDLTAEGMGLPARDTDAGEGRQRRDAQRRGARRFEVSDAADVFCRRHLIILTFFFVLPLAASLSIVCLAPVASVAARARIETRGMREVSGTSGLRRRPARPRHVRESALVRKRMARAISAGSAIRLSA